MELPVYSGKPEPLVNRRLLDRRELRQATGMGYDADRDGKVGPLKYDTTASVRLTRPGSASARFSTQLRLGYALEAPRGAAGSAIRTPSPRKTADDGAAVRGKAVKEPVPFQRPKSARVVGLPGRGHWCDGMATGTTIVGVYNRFRIQIPGVARYDVGSASERNRPHSARASFGTGPRFPGQKAVAPPAPPQKGKTGIFSGSAAGLRRRRRSDDDEGFTAARNVPLPPAAGR